MKRTTTLIFGLILCMSSHSEKALAAGNDSVRVRRSETEGKAYLVKATVKGILREEKKITLAHGKIKGFMPAMTMTFPVSNVRILDKVKIGSKGLFTFLVYKGNATVTGAKVFGKHP